jgi:hypothetical protein
MFNVIQSGSAPGAREAGADIAQVLLESVEWDE